MNLAKASLDVGLFTNNVEAMLHFYQDDIGLLFEELLPTGGGSRQHRHGLNGSVLKINESRDPLPPAAASGYQRLTIATDRVAAPVDMSDPDGNAIRLVSDRSRQPWIEVEVTLADLAAGRQHYGVVLGFEQLGDDMYQCGTTRVHLVHQPGQAPTGELRAVGFRYLTVQVWDADLEYQRAVNLGATGAMPPRTSGAVARFGFVRDTGGNWLEISQRASLTGPLPGTPPE